MIKKLFFIFLVFFWIFFQTVQADFIPVEDVFSDIDKNYKYYKELQELYNRWMVVPESDGKFHPEKLLERDEFVGISMEVICKKCIQPNTEDYFYETYTGKYVFFDINESNRYFYCIAEADALDYVRGYNVDYVCENGTSKSWERPFCPDNRITKEEAYAVIMRNSKIWTIQDNESLIASIVAWWSYDAISDDVGPKNLDGTPYTFYGYFKKALEYELVEYDADWQASVYKLLQKQDNKIYPKKYVTKEEFLYLAYVALKANNCEPPKWEVDIALKMEILDKSCNEVEKDFCQRSGLDDPDDTYDFYPIPEWFCSDWIQDPEGYIWRFYNTSTWERFIKYGKYLEDIQLPSPWIRRIYLRVIDNCWNTVEIYSTIVVDSSTDDDLDWEIIITDPSCNESWWNCDELQTCDTEGNICDIDIPIDDGEVCEDGIKSYEWTITHTASWKTYNFTTEFVDDFYFNLPWEWRIWVKVTDNCGNEVYETRKVFIGDIGLNVTIYAVPIIGYAPLLIDFEWFASGGDGKYTYRWDFADGGTWFWKIIDHVFRREWIYLVKLFVKDGSGRSGDASVSIKALPLNCENDSDNDSVNDCDDLCPLEVWNTANNGCPVFERKCWTNCSCPPWYVCESSDVPACLNSYCRPVITANPCLFDPRQDTIFWNIMCNSCPCNRFLDFLASVRKCDVLFPAITSPNSTEIYSRGDVYEDRKSVV